MGDALAIALLEARGFTAEDFAFSHPGGALGKKLLLKVADVMHTGDALPRVRPETLLVKALLEISNKGLGMTTVVDEENRMLGVFTDGDLRRALGGSIDINNTAIGDLMSSEATTITANMLAAEALRIMEERKISSLAVLDDEQHLIGIVHLLSLLQAGIA